MLFCYTAIILLQTWSSTLKESITERRNPLCNVSDADAWISSWHAKDQVYTIQSALSVLDL